MPEQSSVDKFVKALQTGNNADASDSFKDALRDKIADKLDGYRQDVASKIFNPTTMNQTHSDPKPTVADPSPRTDQVMDTDGNQIEFTPNTETQPEAPAPEAPAEVEAPVSNEVEAQ